jgi:hypothetical protein
VKYPPNCPISSDGINAVSDIPNPKNRAHRQKQPGAYPPGCCELVAGEPEDNALARTVSIMTMQDLTPINEQQ